MRLFSILLAAGLCLASTAAAAQKPSAEEAPAFTSPEEALAEMRAMVDRVRSDMLTPGERVPGWNVGGADPDADLRRAGAESHYFLTTDPDGPSITILTDRRIADFAPAAWRVADSYGSAIDALDRPLVQFDVLSPRYVIATRSNSWRRDNVDCTDRIGHAYLYERPGAPASEDDETAPILFRIAMLALEGQTVCSRYEGNAQDGWRSRALLPDGRNLPNLTDADERITIVEAAPIDRLMGR